MAPQRKGPKVQPQEL